MKEGIHPKYHEIEARCACGATWKTRSTKPELHLEICNNCHPFFTGRQKLVDTEGRVERFTKRFGAQTSESRKAAAKQGEEAAGRDEVTFGVLGSSIEVLGPDGLVLGASIEVLGSSIVCRSSQVLSIGFWVLRSWFQVLRSRFRVLTIAVPGSEFFVLSSKFDGPAPAGPFFLLVS